MDMNLTRFEKFSKIETIFNYILLLILYITILTLKNKEIYIINVNKIIDRDSKKYSYKSGVI